MVSPLKTWEYDEPKHFWPVLGGLAVLLHIGILGLSLPYIIEMMQASGGGASSAIEPIELVVVDQAESSAEVSANQRELPPSATATQSTMADNTSDNSEAPSSEAASDSSAVSIGESESQTMRQTVSDFEASDEPSDEASGRTRDSSTPSSDGTTQSQSRASESSAQSTASTEPGITESGGSEAGDETTQGSDSGSSTADSEDGDDGGESTGIEETGEEPSGDGSSSVDELEGLPTAGSGDILPSPNMGSDATTERATYLSIGNPQQVPEELRRDVTDTPPLPTSDTLANAIELSLDSLNCGTVDFSRSGETYKLWIDEAGLVLEATLWTGGQSTGQASGEDAIACLIKNAGFAFEPATLDGEAARSDNLLVTVQVQESTGQEVSP